MKKIKLQPEIGKWYWVRTVNTVAGVPVLSVIKYITIDHVK